MKLLSFLVVITVLLSGFAEPSGACMKRNAGKACLMKHQPNKAGCCNKKNNAPKSNKGSQHTGGSFCYYCILCIAFIIPGKPGVGGNFVFISARYADMAQSKLSDYNPLCWRPPNA